MAEGKVQKNFLPVEKLNSDLALLADQARILREKVWELRGALFGIDNTLSVVEMNKNAAVVEPADTGVIGGCNFLVKKVEDILTDINVAVEKFG